jgi:hypothetical protein
MITDMDAIDLSHIKGVLTESLSVFGSYNLTYPSKHASWEMITLKNTIATDIEFFDNLWATCRPVQEAKPNVVANSRPQLGDF